MPIENTCFVKCTLVTYMGKASEHNNAISTATNGVMINNRYTWSCVKRTNRSTPFCIPLLVLLMNRPDVDCPIHVRTKLVDIV